MGLNVNCTDSAELQFSRCWERGGRKRERKIPIARAELLLSARLFMSGKRITAGCLGTPVDIYRQSLNFGITGCVVTILSG